MNAMLSKTGFDHWTGRLVRRLRRRYNDQCITILTYHSVAHEDSVFTAGTQLRCCPQDLEREAEYLAEHYNMMRLSDLVTMLERGEQPVRAVALTFDDGYGDSIRQAMPILFRRRIPMTIFPVTSVVGNNELMWQHKLAWLVAKGHEMLVWDVLGAEGWSVPNTPEGTVDAHRESIGDFVRRNYQPHLPQVLESVVATVGTSGLALAGRHRPYLEVDDIATADPEFVEFGNHTATHPVLSALTVMQQRSEIEDARQKITEWTGRPPVALAYPFGLKPHYNDASKQLARNTGHRATLDMRRRMNVGLVDPFELSRKPIAGPSQTDFEMMIEDWPANARHSPPGNTA